METGDDDDDDLSYCDQNDNTRVASSTIMETNKMKKVPEDVSAKTYGGVLGSSPLRSTGSHSSPNRCPSRASNISDNLTAGSGGGHLYSPEDTLNNDFFYDDEFAVQFDANLGGGEEDIVDSVELNSLLNFADDNQQWRNFGRMSQSKSDTCLYHPDLDVSGASDANATSSERELLSSSDLSDFKTGPLFSPTPPLHSTNMDDSCSAFHSDSLCNEELAGSLVKDEDRYAFDWTSARDQYMISFDRSPSKYSTEDSYSSDQPPPTKKKPELTSWGQRVSNGNNSSSSGGVCSTGSSGCSSRPSSDHYYTASGLSTSCSGESGSGVSKSASREASCLGSSLAPRSSTDTSTSSTMTTWKLVKQQCRGGKDRVPDGMTTWKKVQEARVMTSSHTTRSKSMPELVRALSEGCAPTESKVPDDPKSKRYSTSLLEMYRQFKSYNGEVVRTYEDPEPMADPVPLGRFEMDTWSVSPASSHQLSPMSDCGQPKDLDGSLIKWNTVPNLTGQSNLSVQAGPALTENHKKARRSENISVQFPPSLNDCAVQTSFTQNSKDQTQKSKALQTSWELLAGAQLNIRRRFHGIRGLRKRPHSAGSVPTDDPYTVQLSKNARERMSRSLFFNSTTLPDISFLRKTMSCSITNIARRIEQRTPSPEEPHVKRRSAQQPTKQSPDSGYRPKKPPRQHRPRSTCLTQSRESSPVVIGGKGRSRSSDSASSFCSSSSSGIDPGSYDSLTNKPTMYLVTRNSRQFDSPRKHHQPTNVKVVVAKDVPQPPKKEVFLHSPTENRCPPKVCNICQAQNGPCEDAQIRPCHLDQKENRCSGYRCDGGAQMTCQCACPGCSVPAQMCLTVNCAECEQAHAGSNLLTPVQMRKPYFDRKPLKSCLAKKKADRQLLAFKHRSWSDPSDGLVLKYSQEGQIKYQLVTHDKECSRRQPLSELDLYGCVEQQEAEVKPVTSPVKNIDGVILRRRRPTAVPHVTATPTNSPEQIPLPMCTCGTTHAVLHSSSDSGDGPTAHNNCCSDMYRAKKSVSFSEEISYHSPCHSPHQSPRRRAKDTGTGVVIRHPVKNLSPKKRPVSLPPDFRLMGTHAAMLPDCIPESPACESPPRDFVVSPPSSITLTPSPTAEYPSNNDLVSKKVFLHDMMKATEKLIYHFGQTRDLEQKMELGSSSECTTVGHLVLEHLCPAVYGIIVDGLKPKVRSLFGKVKNSVWVVVEDSQEIGPSSRVIRELIQDLKTLDFLTSSWLKFNAFVFGLLNHKALDLWLSQLQANDRLLSKHYEPDSFLRLTATPANRPLFLDLVTVIQPLSQMPFRLEYNFEFRELEGKQHQQLSDTILDKHVSRSQDSDDARHWQNQRIQQLVQSDSPVPGEISPVQGQQGRPGGVLHHSAPEISPENRLVAYSPTRPRWTSLYDQVAKSDLAKQTKFVVADTGKNLLKSLKESSKVRLSRHALQDIVHVAVGYTSPVKALPKVPGLTLTSSNDTVTEQPAYTPRTKALAHRAYKVFGSQDLLQSSSSSEDDRSQSESILRRMSTRLFNSPPKAPYKQGVTDYQFRGQNASSAKKAMKKAASIDVPYSTTTAEAWSKRKSLFDEQGLPRSCSLEQAPVDFQIPSRSDSMESSGKNPTKEDKPKENPQLLSPTTAVVTKKLGSSLKKSWSSFGPSLVSLMDRLLLDDPKSKSVESLPTARTETAELVPIDVEPENHTREDSVKSESTDAEITDLLVSSEEEKNWFVQALCHHVAMEDNQLSFTKGTVLAVMKQVDTDWLLCRHGDKEGLVHTACVTKA